jgi:hypothetical protein
MTAFLCILILILIINNQLVFTGAKAGLMLWFHNVIPLLLPFMLLSKLLANSIYQKNYRNNKAVIFTIIPGLLCGYPIGAYTIKNCLENRLYSKQKAELLLPLCNNASPMFITGFIIQKSLNNTVSLPVVLAVIYLPYLLYIVCLSMLYRYRMAFPKSTFSAIQTEFETKTTDPKSTNKSVDLSELIYNINVIGIYIILCSVVTELLTAVNVNALAAGYITGRKSAFISILLSSIEITRGVQMISGLNFFNQTKITALILALTSFGGISSILQTKQVIRNCGLSVKKYIAVKFLCACLSYILALNVM